MTKPEMELELEKLADEYDPRDLTTMRRKLNVYGPERVDAIFKEFRWMTKEQFSALCRRCFVSERKAPLCKDFKRVYHAAVMEAIQLQQEQNWRDRQRQDELDWNRRAGPERTRQLVQELALLTGKETS